MKKIRWSELKNDRLKRVRGVSFEEILSATLIAVKEHPSRAAQKIMLFEYKRYVWVVVFIETDDELFLKTLYPSRKYTKIYRGERK